ncbi:mechanosensitive ion channel family protein [Qipengyuania sp. DSG2-2]|uniref:mechanosensitive ion channel family protein n=1 Tax=Qipengyuania sp. DGS2-2 TaxID=3349631 RepID=UPI0036D2A82A
MFENFDIRSWQVDWSAVLIASAVLVAALLVAYLLYRALFALVGKLTALSASETDHIVVDRMRAPVKWSVLAIAVTIAAEQNALLGSLWEPFARFLRPALLGWIAYTLVKGFSTALELRLEHTEDPVAMRSRRTRIAILSRTATIAIVVITVGLMMLGIPGVRDIGTTLLASAGFAALAIGAAAQPALKSLIAGLQMAITEPVRIGDLVVIDGHTGRVEEIKMSFVIVRTWDERAVIIPTDQFLDDGFENWTRRAESLSGPVFLHLDPIADIGPIRQEFTRFIEAHPLWDKRTVSVLVTEAYPESVEVRMAVSANTVADLFNLRCAAREHMIAWLNEHQPEALIRHRLEVPGGTDKAPEPGEP